MQHVGLEYGQGATNSHLLPHQTQPPFAHTDIISPQPTNGNGNGNSLCSTLRQFRKKDGTLLLDNKDTNNVENSTHIARVPPHNHYPARPDYYRFNPPQYPDFSATFKEATPQQVKYSEIAESSQNVNKEKVDFMDMCNIQHMKHQSYPQPQPPPPLPHHQYDVINPFKTNAESQYQYQMQKYPNQCRKYATSPENDLLAKLQRLHPSMARSIMNDHPQYTIDQNRLYNNSTNQSNQRFYPSSNYNYTPPPPPPPPPQYNNYPSCNYPRTNNTINVSPSRRQYSDLINYNVQKMPLNHHHHQYNTPEYSQHYQHRRIHQDFYQRQQFLNHSITQSLPSPPDRPSSGGIRHYLENWAEEETNEQLNLRNNVVNNNNTNNQSEPLFVINSSDLSLESLSLVPTENGQFIIKSNTSSMDGGGSNVVRIIEENKQEEENVERAVNLHIIEDQPKNDCVLLNKEETTNKENEEIIKDMPIISSSDIAKIEINEETDNNNNEETNNVSSVIEEIETIKNDECCVDKKKLPDDKIKEIMNEMKLCKRTHRIFSVDDIMKKDTIKPKERRCSIDLGKLQLKNEEVKEKPKETPKGNEEIQMKNTIQIEDDSVILEIGGALVQLNINQINGVKLLTVLPLSDNLIVDYNGNYEITSNEEEEKEDEEEKKESEEIDGNDVKTLTETTENNAEIDVNLQNEETEFKEDNLSNDDVLEENEMDSIYNNEIIIGEEIQDNEEDEIQLESKLVITNKESEDTEANAKIEEKPEIVEPKTEVLPVENKVKTNKVVQNEERKKEPKMYTKAAKKSYETNNKLSTKSKENTRNKHRKLPIKETIKQKEETTKSKQNDAEKIKNKEKLWTKRKEEIKVKRNVGKKEEIMIKRRKSRDIESKKKTVKFEDKSKMETNKTNRENVTKRRKVKSPKVEESKLSQVRTEEKTNKLMKMKEEAKIVEPQIEELEDIIDDKLEKMIEEEIRKFEEKHTIEPQPIRKVTFSYNSEEKSLKKAKRTLMKINVGDKTKRKKLSLEEYNSRKQRMCSSEKEDEEKKKCEEINVKQLIPKILNNCWEEEDSCDEYPKRSRIEEILPARKYNCIIDVNEFDIKPIKKSPPYILPKFPFASEDSLQVYKDVVDSKLNSLNLKIPKINTSEESTKELLLINRFLSESVLKYGELDKVKKIIECKRKCEEQTKKQENKEPIKLHIGKLQLKKRKRFRNLYTTETSEDFSSSSDEEDEEKKNVGDYSVFQRGSQAGTVPKLIFKRKSGLPQPFVKLERSQAAEMLIKKKKISF